MVAREHCCCYCCHSSWHNCRWRRCWCGSAVAATTTTRTAFRICAASALAGIARAMVRTSSILRFRESSLCDISAKPTQFTKTRSGQSYCTVHMIGGFGRAGSVSFQVLHWPAVCFCSPCGGGGSGLLPPLLRLVRQLQRMRGKAVAVAATAVAVLALAWT